MPGSMVHLLMAHKVNPEASTLFYLGNIAPDAVTTWKAKDITHFRDLPDRREALTALALLTPQSNDFAEGILLHLYLDWRWDILVMNEFIKTVEGEWFAKYRHEVCLTGAYGYHHTDWAKDVWDCMDMCDIFEYGEIPGATKEELKDFISRNNVWHRENNTESSIAFTPEFVDEFISEVASEYNDWRNCYIKDYKNKSLLE